MSSEWTRLGDALLKQQLALMGPEAEALYALANTPTLDGVMTLIAQEQGLVDRARQALAQEGLSLLARGQWALALRQHEQRLAELEALRERAAERDRRQAERPPGCVCLGLGGRGVLTVTPGTFTPVWSEPCLACPEGQAAASVAAAERVFADTKGALLAAEIAAQCAALALHWARIPPKYADCTFDTYPVQPCNEAVVAWLRRYGDPEPPHEWVYLHGLPSRGKTGLAVALLRAWLAAGRAGRFSTANDFLDAVKATFGRHDGATEAVITRYAGYRLLVLDDLGAEKITEWARLRLFALLDTRKNLGRTTIITSNYDLDELEERLSTPEDPRGGVRIVERLIEQTGGAQCVFRLDGRNLRGGLA